MNELITKEYVFTTDESGNIIVSPEAIKSIREIETGMKAFKKTYDKYKKILLDGMEEYGIKKVDTDDLLITYCEPTERITIDNEKLWAEHKSVAFECQKFVPVKASIRVTVR